MSEEVSKIIITESMHGFNDPGYAGYFSKDLNYRSHASYVKCEEPIKDFKGDLNKHILLRTIWFSGNQAYWHMTLDGENGYVLGDSKSFGQLNEHFMNYSLSRLDNWQKEALKEHNRALRRLEDYFFKGEDLPENFFNFKPSTRLISQRDSHA